MEDDSVPVDEAKYLVNPYSNSFSKPSREILVGMIKSYRGRYPSDNIESVTIEATYSEDALRAYLDRFARIATSNPVGNQEAYALIEGKRLPDERNYEIKRMHHAEKIAISIHLVLEGAEQQSFGMFRPVLKFLLQSIRIKKA